MSNTMRNTILGIIAIIIIAVGAYFIFKKPATPMTNEQAAAQQQGAASTTPDQVQAQDVKVGEGKVAAPGSKVSVLYVGQLQDGTVFDSSAAHNNQPLVFTLGVDQLIPGFQIGINGMKEGGERLIAIPPSLGYGTQDVKDQAGKVIIPANSTLVFDVKLVKVEPGATPPATAPAKK